MRLRLSCLFLFLGLLAAGAAPARAAGTLLDAPISFSAHRTVTVDGRSYSGVMFHVPGKERHDQELLGMREEFILDGRGGAGWLIAPSLKTLVSFPFPPVMAALVEARLPKRPVGEDVIAGLPTTKYRIDDTIRDGTRAEGFIWISPRGVLMKLDGAVVTRGGHRTTVSWVLSDVKEGPQDPNLFTIPTGFTELPAEALMPLLGLGRKS